MRIEEIEHIQPAQTPTNHETTQVQAEGDADEPRDGDALYYSNTENTSPLLVAGDDGRLTALLTRHFIQIIAPWFDICDPTRQFGTEVPVRARRSSILMNSICTASARSLVRLKQRPVFNVICQVEDDALAGLNLETVVHFQNECIRELLHVQYDSVEALREEVLAAAIILRTDEEMNIPLCGDTHDRQVFLSVTSAFLRHQASQIPSSLPSPFQAQNSELGDLGAVGWGVVRTDGLRQACFWVAFRQELHAAVMQQRSLRISLAPYRDFWNLTPTEGSSWAHRLVVFCAEVVQHCYGGVNVIPPRGRAEWEDLKQQADVFEACLPESYQPIYLSQGQMFPEIWYTNSWHATGAAYFELSKILLYAFETRDPLRPGYRDWFKNLGQCLRSITKRLCGIATSNRTAPPLFLLACSAIVMCGEFFEDPVEQASLIDFLTNVELEFGYPNQHVITRLREAWKQ